MAKSGQMTPSLSMYTRTNTVKEMDLKLLKMLCKDSKQHHAMFHGLCSVSSLLCIAQNVRFQIPYKVLYFETPFLTVFKYYAWVSCGVSWWICTGLFAIFLLGFVKTNCRLASVAGPGLRC